MSDLIERPKSIGEAWRKLIQQQAEIERLKEECKLRGEFLQAEVHNRDKLQAVVDIHKKIMKYPTIRDFIGSILANKSDEAIAALEGADDE